MKSKSTLNVVMALIMLAVYLLLLVLFPIYTTTTIFKYSPWLAWGIVYLVTMIAIAYGIKSHRVDIILYQWFKKRFGLRIF